MYVFPYSDHFDCVQLPCYEANRFRVYLFVAREGKTNALPVKWMNDKFKTARPATARKLTTLTMPLVSVGDVTRLPLKQWQLLAMCKPGVMYSNRDEPRVSYCSSIEVTVV